MVLDPVKGGKYSVRSSVRTLLEVLLRLAVPERLLQYLGKKSYRKEGDNAPGRNHGYKS